MKELFNKLEQFRYSELDSSTFWLDTDKCIIRHTGADFPNIIFSYKDYVILVSDSGFIHLINTCSEKTIDLRIPYKCEDKNEFFQLSTKYDYGNMSYEDLVKFHDLCDFMIKRDLRERK